MATPAEILELATQYHATGNTALAEQYATSVLDEEPNHAGALHLLGLIAQQNNKPAEALVYLNRSLTANGSNALAWQHAADLLLAAGDLPGGITYYEQALRLRPDFAEGYNTLGIALKRVGQLGRAIECFRTATRLAPNSAPAHNNLGTALTNQGKWDEAAAAFEEALKLWPDSPDVAFNLGNTRFDQGDLNEAIVCYRRALAQKPSYAVEVSNNLATALRKQGHWEEAIAQYKDTLRMRPDHPMAIFNLSELAVAGQYTFSPEELGQVKDFIASGRNSEHCRSLLAFAAANVLDLQGAFDEAFRYYREANDLQLRLFKQQKTAFNARTHQATIDKIIADHGASYFEKVKDWGIPAELPVFMVGLPYSGPALVEEILTRHPKLTRVGATGSVVRFLTQTVADKSSATTTAQLLPDMQATRMAAANYLQSLTQFGQGAARLLVNSSDNLLGLGLIGTLFPGARVIHCRRQPFDLGLACYFQNRRDLAFACSLEDIAAYYLAHEKLMAHWAQVLPLTIHEVHYEELIDDQEIKTRALLDFCGLEWNEGTIHSDQPRVSNAAELIGHSQHYLAHLGPLIKALQR